MPCSFCFLLGCGSWFLCISKSDALVSLVDPWAFNMFSINFLLYKLAKIASLAYRVVTGTKCYYKYP